MKLSNPNQDARQHHNCTHPLTKGLPAQIIAKIRKGQDVLPGKGEHIKQLNNHYRHLIRHYHLAYHDTETNQAKRAIAELVLKEIHKMGGRFLNTQFEEMEETRATKKVMKALKDAKKCCGKWRSIAPVALSLTPPNESNIEPGGLDTNNQDFKCVLALSPIISSASNEAKEMEHLDQDVDAAPPSELAVIDSFNFDLFSIDITDEDTGDPFV